MNVIEELVMVERRVTEILQLPHEQWPAALEQLREERLAKARAEREKTLAHLAPTRRMIIMTGKPPMNGDRERERRLRQAARKAAKGNK